MQIGDACAKEFGRTSQAPWSVTLDHIEEQDAVTSDDEATPLCFTAETGCLTAYLWMERPVISAIMEAALGGMGTEAAFLMPERSMSKIEQGVIRLTLASMMQELALMLGREFAKPFTSCEAATKPAPTNSSGPLVFFRYVVNLFDYSGEMRISISRSELLEQLGSPAEADILAAGAAKQLQVEIGKSELSLTVSLGPEVLSVEDIAALKPGKLLELASTASMPVTVWSSGVAAYQGTLARAGDRLAVCLTTALT